LNKALDMAKRSLLGSLPGRHQHGAFEMVALYKVSSFVSL
jgi:hypothetical protein